MNPSKNSFTNNKRIGEDYNHMPSQKISPRKKSKTVTKTATLHFQHLGLPLCSTSTGSPLNSIRLEPDRPYTIGRTHRSCDFTLNNRFVSKQHCQIFFDSDNRRIYIIDGAISSRNVRFNHEFRRSLLDCTELEEEKEIKECIDFRVRVSLNGLILNGVRVEKRRARELFVGDEVMFGCGSEGLCGLGNRIGFLIQGIVFKEVVFGLNEVSLERPRYIGCGMTSSGHSQGTMSSGNRNKRVFACQVDDNVSCRNNFLGLKCSDVIGRAKFLLSQCTNILGSDDPVTYIRRCDVVDFGRERTYSCRSKSLVSGEPQLKAVVPICRQQQLPCDNSEHVDVCAGGDHFLSKDSIEVPPENGIASGEDVSYIGCSMQNKIEATSCLPPGKKFCLNRLEFMDHSSLGHYTNVSLPELLSPVKSILRIFIATFTCDILWFLSFCKIPANLPVTVACHNKDRCWSSNPDKRASLPYPDFPNLVLVYPPFPEALAFGKDRKNQGIACHHPKVFVVQRDDSIRVIITSANLGAKQWNRVTNTVWWQDFPRRSAPDYSSLFVQHSEGEINQDSRSDFAAHLAGFVATLLIDVPSQAHWVAELTKYDFDGAVGHLIASVPGIHLYRTPYVLGNEYASWSYGEKLLGSVEASVVGLSHLFYNAADSKGVQLKRLAAFLGKSHQCSYGMSEVVLRRNSNVPADVNAVSVLIPNPDEFSKGDCVQLGFLPRNIAKWVSPLWDIGFFKFFGSVCHRDALAAASGETNKRVLLMLHVSQGPHFSDISEMMQPEHVIALCSLITAIQRCTGLWRLQQVLGQYKWPEPQESEFIYGASSIGSSVNPQFLAAFAAAAGKRSLQFFESEESDPDWGCWSACQELKHPSIGIIFPTIERVKNARDGILPSKRLLCFSEKTWQRLRTLNILHDSIPYPRDRMSYPMHVKVALRRFQSRMDASSFGWVYCGSHNFSAAAWGQPISHSFGTKGSEPQKNSSLRICNYELGIIFIFPPAEAESSSSKESTKLDDIVLPFVVPAPKYDSRDRPATAQAMREALAEVTAQERERLLELETTYEMMEEIPDEEEDVIEGMDYVAEEKEEEKAYAETLWSHVDSSQSC
ncbi:FHA domain-containing protein/Tyr-DNA_phospho domain-containing protein/HIRAN domain-containing protein [Cephalotus follicularis]|uniref:FHA domain-containing protein/Tyr-DNA_phospho domain-containing protein/HIRAN domain-containing protein n=1 Tax=Cephalotus follicularis TaxID=3775 RepID=A0A1Q3BZT8_CEPFO|nr:FHA domain-containing protein/Tyr-DNA_phospho domain-containing protein/HIRAN domain-containing protein [Cephalotus follicularis]